MNEEYFIKLIYSKYNQVIETELKYLAIKNALTWEWYKLAVLISESDVFKMVYKEIGLEDKFIKAKVDTHFVERLETIIHYKIDAL